MNDSYSWKPFAEPNIKTNLDIELLKSLVGRYFPIYDVRFNLNAAAFFCRVDTELLEENFNSLRDSLKEKGYIPMLRYEKGEHVIHIIKKPEKKLKPIWVNYFLLISTIVTTILTGSILYNGYYDIWNMPDPVQIFTPINLFYGALLFAFPLMSILIIHEMGHYYISKKHGISASLPYFLPIPPIVPSFNIGTFGALISTREPIPNRKALFDIGIAGPLAGFLVALPITIFGIATSEVIIDPQLASGDFILGSSPLIIWISHATHNISFGTNFALNMNPIAFAGWVGLLITSINLFPASQLDGGHIFRAVLGDKQKYASWIAVIIMILTGWLFFAFVIIFIFGVVHPPPLNDSTKLDYKRKLLFIAALAMMILCYVPNPFNYVE